MSEEYEELEELIEEEDEQEEQDKELREIKLMGDSEQTMEERQKIRREQRGLFKEMEERGEAMDVVEARDRNNEIYKKVKHTREAVLDGDNMKLIATKASQKIDSLIQVPRYDADKLVSVLKRKVRDESGCFNWVAFGRETTVCFNAIPSRVSFLNGPLTGGKPLQVKQRAQRPKRFLEEGNHVEANPEDVEGHTTKDADQLSAVEQSMKVLDKTLKTIANVTYNSNKERLENAYNGNIPEKPAKRLKQRGSETCGIHYLFNPKSFTQTVENIFHYSFLVKKSSASLGVREKDFGAAHFGEINNGGPMVKYITKSKTKKHPTPKQAIVNLTMRDYRRLLKAYQVTEGQIPHRTGSKQTKRIQLSQRS